MVKERKLNLFSTWISFTGDDKRYLYEINNNLPKDRCSYTCSELYFECDDSEYDASVCDDDIQTQTRKTKSEGLTDIQRIKV